jgi:hypothetical protein
LCEDPDVDDDEVRSGMSLKELDEVIELVVEGCCQDEWNNDSCCGLILENGYPSDPASISGK